MSVNRDKLVSIITPCYNDGEWIIDTITSVLNSTYENIEMIIVDDCSTDSRTIEILKSIDDRRVKIFFNEKNQGVCKTRNIAFSHTSGEYILPVDGDDLISSDYIALAVEVLDSRKEVAVVATNYKKIGERNKYMILEDFSMGRLLGHNIFPITAMLRREDYVRVGGFNEDMSLALEDWDFWISILGEGGEVHYLDGFHFFYRIKKKKLSRNAQHTSEADYFLLRKIIWENHRELFSKYYCDPRDTLEYLSLKHTKVRKHVLRRLKQILSGKKRS